MADDATLVRLQAELRELRARCDEQAVRLGEMERLGRENAALAGTVTQHERALAEALEQQAAIGDVLTVIASSPNDLQQVLDTIATAACRLCDSDAAAVQRRFGDRLFTQAVHNRTPGAEAGYEILRVTRQREVGPGEHPGIPLSLGSAAWVAMLDWTTVHVENALVVEESFPRVFEAAQRIGFRTFAATPLLHGDEVHGVLTISNFGQPRPFTSQQLRLLEAFASQAAIAIANTNLIEQLDQRNHDLAEALEQQTATAEILRIIATSPTDAQPVLDAIVQSASRLTGSPRSVLLLVDGDQTHVVATVGTVPDGRWVGDRGWRRHKTPGSQALREVRTIHMPDVSAPDALAEYPEMNAVGSYARLLVPLIRDRQSFGLLTLNRERERPFTPREIALVEAFADQAVIAIENTRLFQALQEANERLAEASQHKSQFLANMSHELRTPLNAIIGYSEMLQEEAEEIGEEAFIPDLQKVNAAGKHLLGLINDILDLSKIEAGRMDLYLETFSVNQLVQDVAAIVQPLMEKNGNQLVVTCPPDVGTMHADQTKLRQTLFNLLSNAAKFTDHDRIELRVHLTPQPPSPARRGGRSVTCSPSPRRRGGWGVR